MLGARLASHLPGAGRPSVAIERQAQGLFLLWLALVGVLVFGAAWLWQVGGWQRLLSADPTGLTLLIVAIFSASTLWCGQRAWQLGLQQQALDVDQAAGWAHDYAQHIHTQPDQQAVAQALLAEHTHGPHEMAWWVNGIQLKLGLLGKVIGFSVLALQIGQTGSFDPAQSQELLKSLTAGLGIALLTTMVGLVGNILLGLQLTRLDRYADALVADCQREGLRRGAGGTGTTVGPGAAPAAEQA